MARMQRRFGIYCANIPANTIIESKEPTKRHLPRRSAIVGEHNILQISSEFDEQCKATVTPFETTKSDFPGERRTSPWSNRSELTTSDLTTHTIITGNSRLPLHGESPKANTGATESEENELPIYAEKIKKEYVTPSPSDIIIGCLGRRHGGNISVKGYVEALYADQYQEAETRLERALIVCTVLDSIKGRGGKFLKESLSKRGMYYEVDEFYSMKKIEDALNQSYKMAKRISCP